MKTEILNNGIKLIYKYSDTMHTSFCIGLKAGANEENKEEIGVAHALEHMLFKGTKKYNEEFINRKLDELFSMNNAMTNFPYTIYYGVLANDDFKEGFELYSDIVLNPEFNEDGFNEEISIIKEESREWSEDLEQDCEDLLLEYALPNERIGKKIIGSESDIDKITMHKIKEFYERLYVSNNISICVVSKISYDIVKDIVSSNFKNAKVELNKNNNFNRNNFNSGVNLIEKIGSGTSKIQKFYDISYLSLNDITLLRFFNMYFGEGVSSILYNEIRTKNGFAYEVNSSVKFENGIKLFKIEINTSKKYRVKVLEILDNLERDIDKILNKIDKKMLDMLIKRYKLKLSLELERSIVVANRSCIYDVMFDEPDYMIKELNFDSEVNLMYFNNLIKKIMKNSATLILE
ncbi:MAG: M16 family metallopeptidase [Sarcina sp.]